MNDHGVKEVHKKPAWVVSLLLDQIALARATQNTNSNF